MSSALSNKSQLERRKAKLITATNAATYFMKVMLMGLKKILIGVK
jgi:hypothetical protein